MPLFHLTDKPPGNGAIALADSPRPPSTAGKTTSKTPQVTETALESLATLRQKADNQFSAGVKRNEEPSSPSPSTPRSLTGDRSRNGSHGFSPIRHFATTYRIRSSQPKAKRFEYGPLPGDDVEQDAQPKDGDDDGAYSDTYFVDEDTLVSQSARGRNRRRWLVCGLVCGLILLAILLALNILLFTARAIYDNGDDYTDSDAIFSNWGLGGTGTESLSWYPTNFLQDVVPIACHSHNDYWRKAPLFSALHAGCIGTETDLWLVDDDLYVGHERSALTPNRTFQSLYVDPLVKILERANPNTMFTKGTAPVAARGVFDTAPNQTLALLVDIKTDGSATFRKVLEQVEPLRKRGWLSTFEDGQVRYGPVTLVGSGNTPFDVIVENSTYRYAFFDAPLASLDNSVYDTTNSYYASVALHRAVGLVWFGSFQKGQLRRMRYQLQQAHARGLQARYWDLPAWPINVRNAVWGTLVHEGVDLLNVDDIKAATHTDWTQTSWL
ncbi:hypothetical protein SEUCBS140593_006931 [Sporothrix eucalyptigena]|uniref:Altered inheritance of mitochondria protein 6 n=1 Tax=Sporothrix eucalyptigena TaxID=1812306 RepID=A0ABP0CBH4_9PEZI